MELADAKIDRFPPDWSTANLAELIEPGARITYGVVQPGENDPMGVLFVRGGDVVGGKISESSLRRIPRHVSNKFERTLLRGGELIISLVGYPGEVAIVPKSLAGANIARQVALVRLIRTEELSHSFVYFFLRSTMGRSELLHESIGSAQQVINLRDIHRVRVPLPPTRQEQEAIAEALGDVDALLEGLDRLIAKKRNLKQAAMQQLLTGKTRLPGFKGEWEVKCFDDILTRLANGALYHQSNSTGFPVTRIETIADGTIDMTRIGYGKPTSELEEYRMRKGDILFSHINSVDHIGKVAFYSGELPLYHGMNLLLLRSGDSLESRFLFFWLASHQGRKKAVSLARLAVSQASINTTDLKRVEIPLPPLPEQQAIAAVLSDMDAEIEALELRRSKTANLKQGMMQELLTGRIRLIGKQGAAI